jgi:valyl-tRNA synthetase
MPVDLLEKGYDPHRVEQRQYAYWESQGLFAAHADNARGAYSIVIPPPNVTGVLHMGHALNATLQDILCRYRRLRGDNVLWMPGTDHAGIATQNVVEKMLAAEGRDRHQLGREAFIDEVWKWRAQSGSAIINQLKRLGASCDWQRERFTMDEGLSRAVRTVFVQLYQEGLIYRGHYIINWCHRCHTALSDLEVEHEEIDGHLYYIRYPLGGGSGGVVIATTRPETMLGDTAVAVNPEDERYQALVGRQVTLPLMNRPIPVIADRYVDMRFGTGALKVTPAHDPNDFEIGARHGLPRVKVIDDEGRMTAEAGVFAGQERFRCREAVVKALRADGLLERVEPIRHSVGHCYRCKTVVEPNLSRQWFVRAKPLADKAAAAVREGRTRIIPEMWAATYFDWLNNIRDWCISRQIWWGHQIPAWTCEGCGEVSVAMETPGVCPECGSRALVQESDVLDTWFSSALWPFSTMGWPERTPLLETFYPTSVLVTGFDILFFWVARMMMMGLHFMGDVPFRDVYVHALVRDEDGKKMSKSKGNVIDPLTIMDEHGTDAFRFTLAAFAAQGRDVRMSEKRVEGYRHFVNKLWNAARFSLMHLEQPYPELPGAGLTLPERWILSRLAQTTRAVAAALDDYRFNEAAAAVYGFLWHELCDWYLEAAKPALYGKAGAAAVEASRAVLWRVLRETLILLHPFMPFVTEEIWQKLPGTCGSILQAAFPTSAAQGGLPVDEASEVEMALIVGVVSAVRNIRGEMNISPSQSLAVTVQSADAAQRAALMQQEPLIIELARLAALSIQETGARPRGAATAVVAGATVYVALEGIIDFAREAQRLEKEIGKLGGELAQLSRKLANEDFLDKAPTEVVAKVREKHSGLLERDQKLQAQLERVRAIGAA